MIIITFKYRYRKQIIIISIILIILIGTISLIIYKTSTKNDKEDRILVVSKKDKKSLAMKDNYEEYKVDIKGEINSPGIYSVKSDSRIIDVITLAGGLSENADTSVINLSKKVIDEMVIIIYSREEVKEFANTKEKEKVVQEKCIQKDEISLKNDACIKDNNTTNVKSENKVDGKISINNASLEELMTLPGIGEAKAKDIIAYREENGGFKSIEELTKVSGIGESTFANIKENITL